MAQIIDFVPLGDPTAFEDELLLARGEDDVTLRQFLHAHRALTLELMTDAHLDLPLRSVTPRIVDPPRDIALFRAPYERNGDRPGDERPDPPGRQEESGEPATKPRAVEPATSRPSGGEHPRDVTDREAVLFAHNDEIDAAADYLSRGLSVLIQCEKLLVEHLAEEIALRAVAGDRKRDWSKVAIAPPAADEHARPVPGGNRRIELLAALQAAVADASDGEIVVVPHLDLLAGGSDGSLSPEARDLTDLLYERSGCVLLAFIDPTLVVPAVLASRFAIRRAIDILPRLVRTTAGEDIPIGRALVTSEEAELFTGFDDAGLYTHVAGMNAVRLRHALKFARVKHREEPERATFEVLLDELRVFKAQTSNDDFDVPTTTFEDIGGYDDVKHELTKAVNIIIGATDIPEKLRPQLVPRGFIFYGPPGTGKTLFAKAVATAIKGTILVVSGPEITDKYVGESERKVRDLFAQARRNAPAVIVFDEFDSIAAQRTGRDDGGSRAGNAIVAQLLTELDGFRAALPVVIIGTTNRYDLIDKALLRPSRFRAIGIGLPTYEARREIATQHARRFGYRLASDDEATWPTDPVARSDAPAITDELLDRIARATEGMNGDEIQSVFRDARADELVGSRQPADAHRFGRLVGALRGAQQDSAVARASPPGLPTPERVAATSFQRFAGQSATSSRPPDTGGPGAPDDHPDRARDVA